MVSKQARHLAALAAKRRSKRTEGTSSQPVQADSDPECDDVEARDSTSGDDKAHPAEEVGAAARRQRDTIRKRVFRNRWRGLGAAAAAMSAFIVRTSSQKSLDALGAAVAHRACEAVVMRAKVQEAQARRKAQAEAKADKKRQRKRQVPPPVTERKVLPRKGSTFMREDEDIKMPEFVLDFEEKLEGNGTSTTKLAPRRRLTQGMTESLHRIATKRMLLPCDVVGGEALARVEWEALRDDQWELRKVYAMSTYARLRATGDGRGSRDCYDEAARSVVIGNGHQVNWQTVRRWVMTYVGNCGHIRPDGRGRHTSCESFLDDADTKRKAQEWLRCNVRSGQARTAGVVPLTTLHFWRWCNENLLTDQLRADSARKPIHLSTSSRWLQKLGFLYKQHTKTIYFDGHERNDVVEDRMEKLVMLKVLEEVPHPHHLHQWRSLCPLEDPPPRPTPPHPVTFREVTVTFRGRDCEDTVWPLLHPGERPVVRVSQDESTFHANDDCPGEWCEVNRGMSIKKKSRGGFIMVSMFISELRGKIRCTPEQMHTYIALHPQSHMAAKLLATPLWDGDSMLLLEPGAGKVDKWFDAEQLMEQTK